MVLEACIDSAGCWLLFGNAGLLLGPCNSCGRLLLRCVLTLQFGHIPFCPPLPNQMQYSFVGMPFIRLISLGLCPAECYQLCTKPAGVDCLLADQSILLPMTGHQSEVTSHTALRVLPVTSRLHFLVCRSLPVHLCKLVPRSLRRGILVAPHPALQGLHQDPYQQAGGSARMNSIHSSAYRFLVFRLILAGKLFSVDAQIY